MLLIISLSLPGIALLGYLALAATRLKWNEPEFFQTLYITLALGLLANYSLTLLLHSLTLAQATAAVAAGLGLILAATRRQRLRSLRFSWARAGILLYLAALYGIRIMSNPIDEWDPRSIWFFHAKIIFFHQALDAAAEWNNPAITVFAHVDYPKLLAVLAAQVAHTAGYWNEFLPNFALVLILVPALTAVAALARRRISSLMIWSLVFFNAGMWLWNGYLDGPLTLYTAIAVIYLGQWFSHRRTPDLLAGLVSAAVIANLKNEGSLLILAFAIAAALMSLLRDPDRPRTRPNLAGTILFTAIAFSGFFLWIGLKTKWGLSSDLEFGPAALSRATTRLSDPNALRQILTALILTPRLHLSLLFAAVAALGARFLFGQRPSRAALFPLLTLIIYFSGLFCIYCLTPYELEWHITASADRTVLPLLTTSFCLSYFVFADAEDRLSADGLERAGDPPQAA